MLFALNNLPAHDMKTAQLFRDLEEPLRFSEIGKFGDKPKEDLPDPVVDFELSPQFLTIIPSIVRMFFNRYGFPPPIAQEALDFLDRLDSMTSSGDVAVPEEAAIVPPAPESESGPDKSDEQGGSESVVAEKQDEVDAPPF